MFIKPESYFTPVQVGGKCMSRKKASLAPTAGTSEDAEEFMALLLRAQKDVEHDCAFIKYFRKMGDRMLEAYQEP